MGVTRLAGDYHVHYRKPNLGDTMKRTLTFAIASLAIATNAAAENRPLGTWTRLHEAARHDTTILINRALWLGSLVNARDEDGHTPLHVAATSSSNDPQAVRRLLEADADPNIANLNGVRPLHYAALVGNERNVVRLIAAGADPNASDNAGATALHYAAGLGRTGAVTTLIAEWADADATDDNGKTPADYARERWEFAEHDAELAAQRVAAVAAAGVAAGRTGLLATGILFTFGPALLAEERRRGREYAIVLLSEASKAAKTEGTTRYHPGLAHAAERGDLETLNQLIELGVALEPTDEEQILPLHAAARGGESEAIRTLIKAGVNVHATSKTGETAVHYAASEGHKGAISTLAALGADVGARNDNGVTPLHRAAWGGRTRTVHALLDAGAEIDAQTTRLETPVHYAARQVHSDTCAALIDRGADLTLKNHNGRRPREVARKEPPWWRSVADQKATLAVFETARWTPLHHAAAAGATDEITALLADGADVDGRDGHGYTPLHEAARHGQTSALLVLLDAGADVDAQAADLAAPVHLAAGRGHARAIRELRRRGANLTLKNEDGRTPYEVVKTTWRLSYEEEKAVLAALGRT